MHKKIRRGLPNLHGITLKKQYGQHFLRETCVIDTILNNVDLKEDSNVFEIGSGEGFLTKAILKKPIAKLWVFEIDKQWVDYLKNNYSDNRLTIFNKNILDVDFEIFCIFKPWTLLANLPYQITFPILYKLYNNKEILKEAVIMIQEEVAQKLTAKGGRNYGFQSLFFQHYFELKLLDKIKPEAFYPQPKVYSRLLYLKPKVCLQIINNESEYWEFIKRCFSSPRRTLKNNLQTYHYDLSKLSENIPGLRAQQLSPDQLLEIWNRLI